MAQGVFQALRSGVGGAGKGTERGNVGKKAVIEAANVQRTGYAHDHVSGGLQQVLRQVQAVSKIVGAAGWNVADRGVTAGPVKAGDYLIEGAVAADA